MVVLGALLAVSTACGVSEEDKIVMKNPINGTARTYKDVREMIAAGDIDLSDTNCAEFAAFGVHRDDVTYPEGQAAFIAACEAGLKAKKP